MRRQIISVFIILLFSCCAGSVATADINTDTALNMAIAMDIDPADIVSASFGTSDPFGLGVATGSLGKHMPRKGNSFAILSTGDVTIADDENLTGDAGVALSGLKNSEGQDMVQLTLTLAVPTDANCVSFDFAFYSEEFPENENAYILRTYYVHLQYAWSVALLFLWQHRQV